MSNARIIELANELAQELVNDGYDIRSVGIDGIVPDYLSFDVRIFRYIADVEIQVKNIGRGWEVSGEYTGTGFEGEEDD